MKTPVISFIIVSWNAKDFLRKCLDTIREHASGLETETIVVDNASADGSPEMVKSDFPWVRLIESGGFAGGNNIGIEAASGQYLALVNSDVEILPDCLTGLVSFMASHPGVGVAGPRTLNTDGTLQRSCRHRPTLWRALLQAFTSDDSFPRITHPRHDTEKAVDTLSGCFWFARRAAVDEVGGLDQRFFMYSEDVDWCKRFRDAGWQCFYVPSSEATHHGGASSGAAPIRYYLEMHRAQLQYYRKHHGIAGERLLMPIMFVHQFIRWIRGMACATLVSRERDVYRLKTQRSLACMAWLLKGRPATAQPET